MNIFFLSKNPEQAAKSLHDKHLVKAILETAQILCTTHHVLETSSFDRPVKFYKATHKNHPCVKWTRECRNNYVWLSRYGMELIREFRYRFEKDHATRPIMEYVHRSIPFLPVYDEITNPPLCMPDEFKLNDSIKSYINYYIKAKSLDKNNKRMDKYTKRERPGFWKPNE